jgi:hypothetical protein
MMSAAAIANGGGVAAGSLVAVLQSAGAAGLGAGGMAAVGGAAGAVGASITGAALRIFGKGKKTDTDSKETEENAKKKDED